MRTLRFFFHIGRVECVTFHVPLSQVRVGGVMEAEDSDLRLEGERRVVFVGDDIVFAEVCLFAKWSV